MRPKLPVGTKPRFGRAHAAFLEASALPDSCSTGHPGTSLASSGSDQNAAPWTVVYSGEEPRYAVQGIVPGYVLERGHPLLPVASVDFSLQTKGTEVHREKLSKHSPVVSFQTASKTQALLGEESQQEASDLATHETLPGTGTLHQLPCSSVCEASRQESSAQPKHSPVHEHYTGVGQGRLYL